MTGVAVEAAIDTPQEQTFFSKDKLLVLYTTLKKVEFLMPLSKLIKIRIFKFFLVRNALLRDFIAWRSYKK